MPDDSLRLSALAALAELTDPVHGVSLEDARRIGGLVVKDGQIGVMLSITPEERAAMEPLRQQAEAALKSLPGAQMVHVVLTAAQAVTPPKEEAPTLPRARWNREPLPGVDKILAIASGKGGVGKSTVTLLLALALKAAGKRVGVLDADIHGPSMAYLLGLSSTPDSTEGLLRPQIGRHGIPALSMGGMMAEGEALVWRGPQLGKTLQQLSRGADWASCYAGQGLDYLLIDLPPGTGDVQLSLAQQLPINAALLVTIPSALSVLDATRAATMFKKVGVPLLGVVENMAGLPQADGTLQPIFGQGGGQALAEKSGAPLLAQLPVWPRMYEEIDKEQYDDRITSALAPVLDAAQKLVQP